MTTHFPTTGSNGGAQFQPLEASGLASQALEVCAPAVLPDRVRVVRPTASLRAGETLFLDVRDGLFVGPAWYCVRAEDIRRGWGFFFGEVAA
jgi:hypothetical protein